MTPTAVSVRPGTTFKEIARLLDEYDITAVPVVDDIGRPVGVVSEADLLRKQTSVGVGITAGALMTSPAVVAKPEWDVPCRPRWKEARSNAFPWWTTTAT